MGESNDVKHSMESGKGGKKKENDDKSPSPSRRRRPTEQTAAARGDDYEVQAAVEDDSSVETTERGRTFRNRRLTLPRHHTEKELPHAASDAANSGSPAGGPSPRKKLKTTNTATTTKTTTAADSKSSKPLKSRVHHAGRLPPVSPRTKSSHPLYTTLRDELPAVESEQDGASKPAWKHRHTFDHDEQDHKLPFPRHVVGTFSVHGVEPVYDSEYEDAMDGDEDWMEPAVVSDAAKPHEEAKTQQDDEEGEKLTTVAKINQDRGGVAYPYANSHRTALFAAYDGHGQGGELVSQFALHEVQKRLEKHPKFASDIEKAFKEIFVRVDEDLTKEPLIQPLYAGTTACVVLIKDSTMTISNAGDSRAVLARRCQKGEWEAINLSHDQNPDVPEEQARIEEAGGFVSPPPEPGLSARVWLDDAHSQIGLAMARSIGDHAVSPVGVIAEPVVTSHDIDENDDFLILATDGVWEFIDSDEAVGIVGEHLSDGATKACQALIEAAASKWHEEEGSYRDDITALVVRLQGLWDCTGY